MLAVFAWVDWVCMIFFSPTKLEMDIDPLPEGRKEGRGVNAWLLS